MNQKSKTGCFEEKGGWQLASKSLLGVWSLRLRSLMVRLSAFNKAIRYLEVFGLILLIRIIYG